MSGRGGVITELARAKVNLTLEVLGRRPDGYHELVSLVAFAGLGDRLELSPAGDWSLSCEGPAAKGIEGDNLAGQAAAAVRVAWPDAAMGHLHLFKSLPVAAGLGGGSADAAAALRALRRLNEGRAGAPDWLALARQLGADVPVCFIGKLAVMRGLGERIDAVNFNVALPAVLVNPGTPLATARVFGDLAAQPLSGNAQLAGIPEFGDTASLLAWILAGRNDLEAPALRLAPSVGRVRAALQAQPDCRVARLSGSGPTCFGLFETPQAARAAAEAIAREQPDWWVQATALG